MTTMPFMSTASTLSTAQLASSTPRPTTNTFQPPTFVFPTVNPFVLNFQMVQLNVTINCTVTWDGDLSQLTTTWSYNGTIIKNSQRYVITEAGLLIRQITPQDVGTYECTVKHPSGWNASHQYFISVKGNVTTSNLITLYFTMCICNFQMVTLYNSQVKHPQRIYHYP